MIQTLDTLCYIQEQTSFVEDYNKMDYGYKIHDRGPRFFVEFDAILQSFDVMNRNRRVYEAANIMERIEHDEYIQDQLRKNSWMGEIDHPAPEHQGEELTINRISNPDMTRTSHYIRKPWLDGNLLKAHIQTDNGTDAGMNMAFKIVDGKIIPCFSARVLGGLQNRSSRPVVVVRKLVTYDWVLFPSHHEAEALIKQPILESAKELEEYTNVRIIFFPELAKMAANSSKETEWLCESFGLDIDDVIGVTETGNSVVIAEDANIYVQPICDKTVRAATRSRVTDWLKR